jgi:ankyrin repeat protein
MYALSLEKDRFVAPLLKLKPDLSLALPNGRQALHVAAEFGRDSVLVALIKAGASPTAADARGWLPIHVAAAANQKKTCDTLLKNKTPINAIEGDGNTPLMVALESGAADAATIFIKAEADLTIANKKQQAPVHFFAASGNIALIKSLQKKNLNWNLPDASGKTPVVIAAEAGQPECFGFIITKLGGEANTLTPDGNTLAHAIAAAGHAALLPILAGAG